MSAQRKKYLQLADEAAKPQSKLFYKLMADLAPAVNGMARAQVNQVGASIPGDVWRFSDCPLRMVRHRGAALPHALGPSERS